VGGSTGPIRGRAGRLYRGILRRRLLRGCRRRVVRHLGLQV